MPVDAPLYPVNLIVEGRRCLVVGGGKVAARKVAGLRACGAEVHVVAPEVSEEIRADAGVTFEERPFVVMADQAFVDLGTVKAGKLATR